MKLGGGDWRIRFGDNLIFSVFGTLFSSKLIILITYITIYLNYLYFEVNITIEVCNPGSYSRIVGHKYTYTKKYTRYLLLT